MNKEYELELLSTAQHELEEIGRVHLELAGPNVAKKTTDRILSSLAKLKTLPDSGIACRDRQLAAEGYRMLTSGDYFCVYRKTGNTIYIYHIVEGKANFPRLFSDIKKVRSNKHG